MNKTYKRWQLLLYNEEGKPGGFIRFEQNGSQVAVEARAEGVGDGARLLLVPAGQGEPLSLGAVSRCAAKCTLPSDELEGYTQVAIVRGDKLLVFGGEDTDYLRMRKKITKPRQPYPQAAARTEAATAVPARVAAMDVRGAGEPAMPLAPEHGPHTMAAAKAHEPAAIAEEAEPASGPEYTLAAEPPEDAPPAAAEEAEHTAASGPEYTLAKDPPQDVQPAAKGSAPEPHDPIISVVRASQAPGRFEQEGWVITRHHAPDAPERIEGRLMRSDGRLVYTLQGVEGAYAPEPPPGLAGYAWDAGFWLLVQPVGEGPVRREA